MRYVEWAIGKLSGDTVSIRRNMVSPIDDPPPAKEENEGLYRSIYTFPEEFLWHVQKTGSVSGYIGECFVDGLWFDIDNKDLNKALTSTRELLASIADHYVPFFPGECAVYFSGGKGFHVFIPGQQFGLFPKGINLARIQRTLALAIARDADIDTTIYEQKRIFRVVNSRHEKSGLYKVRLNSLAFASGALTLENILEQAKTPQPDPEFPPAFVNLKLKKALSIAVDESIKPTTVVTEPQVLVPPSNRKLCIYKLLAGVKEGGRHDAALRIAVHFRKEGFSQPMVAAIMYTWRDNNPGKKPDDDEIQQIVSDVFSRNYDYGCWDTVLDSVCDKTCFLYQHKQSDSEKDSVYTLEQLGEKYKAYIQSVEHRRARTGIAAIDQRIRGIAPGEVLTIVARAGSYKSALGQNILTFNAGEGRPGIFFSIEMPGTKVFERQAMMALKQSGEAVEKHFRDDDKSAKRALEEMKKYPNLFVCDQVGINLTKMGSIVKRVEAETGFPPLILIDYLQIVHTDDEFIQKSNYAQVTAVVRSIKDMAKAWDTPIIVISQSARPLKEDEKHEEEILGRDSGAIEEAADFVITLRKDVTKGKLIAHLKKNRNASDRFTTSSNLDVKEGLIIE